MPRTPHYFAMPSDIKVGEPLADYRKRIAAARRVAIDYTNHRGQRETRTIEPIEMRFGSTEWHTEDQWLLDAHCLARGETRTFAMKDIHAWLAVAP